MIIKNVPNGQKYVKLYFAYTNQLTINNYCPLLILIIINSKLEYKNLNMNVLFLLLL